MHKVETTTPIIHPPSQAKIPQRQTLPNLILEQEAHSAHLILISIEHSPKVENHLPGDGNRQHELESIEGERDGVRVPI